MDRNRKRRFEAPLCYGGFLSLVWALLLTNRRAKRDKSARLAHVVMPLRWFR